MAPRPRSVAMNQSDVRQILPAAARARAAASEPGCIVLRNLHRRWPVNLRLLRRIMEAAGPRLTTPAGFGPVCWGEVGVYLVGARKMAFVNQRYLEHVGPTDVITFDYSDEPAAPGEPRCLQGEIFVCLDVARSQAGVYRTSWQAELVRYVVHGLLHLCGFDDLQPDARRRMKRVENRIFRRLQAGFAFKRLAPAGRVPP